MYVPDVDCEIIYKYFQLFLFPGTLDHRCISRKHLIIKYVKEKKINFNVDSFRLLYFFSFLICVHRVSVYTGYSFDNIKNIFFNIVFLLVYKIYIYICLGIRTIILLRLKHMDVLLFWIIRDTARR